MNKCKYISEIDKYGLVGYVVHLSYLSSVLYYIHFSFGKFCFIYCPQRSNTNKLKHLVQFKTIAFEVQTQ
jgi:hypothetical protein